jgi:uncharacterized protein DUF6925
MATDLHELLAAHLRSARSSWSIGAFGAIAEFHRDDSEETELSALSAVTARGAIAVRAGARCRAFAYEMLSARAGVWLHGIALCLPEAEARMEAREAIAELGPDHEAARPRDRDEALFDLGLGLANCEFCVRTADSEMRDALRAAVGSPLLASAPLVDLLKRASPHRVMRSRAGRIEVFQDIAPEGGRSPTGPHTHLLPRFLRQRRTHAANIPIPEGWLPCLSLYPPNPLQDEQGNPRPFDRSAWEAFQALLERYGDPGHLRVKRQVTAAVRAGSGPDALVPERRRGRAACRIALRQMRQTDGDSPALERWRGAFDCAPARDAADAH